MKTKLLASGILLLSMGVARADAPGGIGSWRGTGTSFDRDGKVSAEFSVELERRAVDEHSIDMHGQVVLTSGKVIEISQHIKHDGDRFSIESNRGKGGGRCFGEGLCESYEDTGNGKGFATTIILDAPGHMRLLTVELDHGEAVGFIRQSLTLIKK